MKLIIYFNNEKHILVDADQVVIKEDAHYVKDYVKEGFIPVNWDNVCFIKEYKPKEEALDD